MIWKSIENPKTSKEVEELTRSPVPTNLTILVVNNTKYNCSGLETELRLEVICVKLRTFRFFWHVKKK